MRARVAYISSLGTTAILVAAALLMLAVVGALVAFRGWPGNANGADVQPVPLGPGAHVASTVVARRAAEAKHVVRVRRTAVHAATKARASTAGLVKTPRTTVVPGIMMEPTPTATMTPVAPGTHGGNPAQSAQPAVAPPAAPNPGDPSQAPGNPLPSGPGNPLPADPLSGTPLLDPSSPPQPPASGDQVTAMVGDLIGSSPPPPAVAAVVDALR